MIPDKQIEYNKKVGLCIEYAKTDPLLSEFVAFCLKLGLVVRSRLIEEKK